MNRAEAIQQARETIVNVNQNQNDATSFNYRLALAKACDALRNLLAALDAEDSRQSVASDYPAPPAARSSTVPVASAWAEGYRQGVEDERAAEAGTSLCGARKQPVRKNPYGEAPPAAVPAKLSLPVASEYASGAAFWYDLHYARGWNECIDAMQATKGNL